MDPDSLKEIERLSRLLERVYEAIDLFSSGLVIKDPNAVLPAPFDFRLGEFSIRDATLHTYKEPTWPSYPEKRIIPRGDNDIEGIE